MIKKILAVVLLSAALFGCSSPPTSGTVVRRDYTPAHMYVQWHCTVYSDKGWCLAQMPYYYPIPDEWQLYITDPKQGQGWVDVSQDEYNRAQPGMHWSETGGLTQ